MKGVRRSDARPDDGLGEGVGKVDDSEAGNVTRSIAAPRDCRALLGHRKLGDSTREPVDEPAD